MNASMHFDAKSKATLETNNNNDKLILNSAQRQRELDNDVSIGDARVPAFTRIKSNKDEEDKDEPEEKRLQLKFIWKYGDDLR